MDCNHPVSPCKEPSLSWGEDKKGKTKRSDTSFKIRHHPVLPKAAHTPHPAQAQTPSLLPCLPPVPHKQFCQEMGAGTPNSIRSLAGRAQSAEPGSNTRDVGMEATTRALSPESSQSAA